MATQLQILAKPVFISNSTTTVKKDMDPTILSPAMG